jgi:hypothetical protein
VNLGDLDYTDQTFQLVARQELSRTAGGTTYGKDLGPALWQASYTSAPIPHSKAVSFEASLNKLNGVIGTFDAYDLRHPYPLQYPNGNFADDATIASINGTKISLKDLPASFQLKAGDYLSMEVQGRRVLHQCVQDVIADSDGETTEFEIRPEPWPGTEEDIAVTLKKPACRMALMPNSVTTRVSGPHTVISFTAGQV